MYLKEMVEKMNGMPTMLVRITFGGKDDKGTAYARPAYYDEREDSATLFMYLGPLEPRKSDSLCDKSSVMERVERQTIMGRGKDNFEVFPHETYLDTMPLRDLPLWAKEMWVRQMEQSTDYSVIDVNRHYKIEMMRKLIAQEGRSGGLSPDMMSDDMKARYLKLWYSFEVIMREVSRGVTVDSLGTVYPHLKTISETVPKIRELPWRNEEGLDPNSWFNREDTYEAMTDMLHSTMESLLLIIQRITADKRTEGNKDG